MKAKFEKGAAYRIDSDVLVGFTVHNGHRIPEYTFRHIADSAEYVGWTSGDEMRCVACCRRIRSGVAFRSESDPVYAFGRHCLRKHVKARKIEPIDEGAVE